MPDAWKMSYATKKLHDPLGDPDTGFTAVTRGISPVCTCTRLRLREAHPASVSAGDLEGAADDNEHVQRSTGAVL